MQKLEEKKSTFKSVTLETSQDCCLWHDTACGLFYFCTFYN